MFVHSVEHMQAGEHESPSLRQSYTLLQSFLQLNVVSSCRTVGVAPCVINTGS